MCGTNQIVHGVYEAHCSVKEKDVAYIKLLCNIKAQFVSHHSLVFSYIVVRGDLGVSNTKRDGDGEKEAIEKVNTHTKVQMLQRNRPIINSMALISLYFEDEY